MFDFVAGDPLREGVAIQAEQRGSGHAAQCAESLLRGFKGTALVLAGDVPEAPRANSRFRKNAGMIDRGKARLRLLAN